MNKLQILSVAFKILHFLILTLHLHFLFFYLIVN